MRNQIAEIAVQWTMNKSLLSHPKIVVHFREIFVAGIRYKCDDALGFGLLPAIAQRAGEQRPSRGATENSFPVQELARSCKTFFVVNFKCIGHKRHVGD